MTSVRVESDFDRNLQKPLRRVLVWVLMVGQRWLEMAQFASWQKLTG